MRQQKEKKIGQQREEAEINKETLKRQFREDEEVTGRMNRWGENKNIVQRRSCFVRARYANESGKINCDT